MKSKWCATKVFIDSEQFNNENCAYFHMFCTICLVYVEATQHFQGFGGDNKHGHLKGTLYTQMEGYLRKYPYQVPYKVPIKYTDYVLYTHQWAKRPQRHIVLIIVVNPEHLSKCTARIQEEISDNFMFIRIKNAIR